MKRLRNIGILLVAVALSSRAGGAFARWAARSRNPTHRPRREGTVNSGNCVRSTASEGCDLKHHLTPARRHPLLPLLTLRGGYSGVDVGGGGIANGDEASGERGPAVAAGGSIDEDLYSRQLYVMGKSAMARMGKADVLISGLRSECVWQRERVGSRVVGTVGVALLHRSQV